MLGGSQALSRSFFSQLIPRGKEAEYFGLYEICDHGTSWLGTLVFGLVHQWTDSYRLAIFALIVFFVVGFALLAASTPDAASPRPATCPERPVDAPAQHTWAWPGWYWPSRSARPAGTSPHAPVHGARFDACHYEAGGMVLVLDYGYGVGDRVSTTIADTPAGHVVGLAVQPDNGDHIALRLNGQVRHFTNAQRTNHVLSAGGTRLRCPSR